MVWFTVGGDEIPDVNRMMVRQMVSRWGTGLGILSKGAFAVLVTTAVNQPHTSLGRNICICSLLVDVYTADRNSLARHGELQRTVPMGTSPILVDR